MKSFGTLIASIVAAILIIDGAFFGFFYANRALEWVSPYAWILGIVWAIAWPILVAVLIFLFLLPLIPNAIASLSNDPNRYRDYATDEGKYELSTFGFFTFLEQGRVKVIERGQKFVRCIMAFDEHSFQGELHPKDHFHHSSGYWEVKESKKRASHPIPVPRWYWGSVLNPFWLWKRWVYVVTGGVFTGIYPFQQVRAYKIERLKMRKVNDPEKKGQVEFITVTDYSDHYRVADFQLFVVIPAADTKDKIPVIIESAGIGVCENPHELAYNTDDEWVDRFYTAYTDAVNGYTRPRPLDSVLSAADSDKEGASFGTHIRDALNSENEKDAKSSLRTIGIRIKEVQLLDVSPVDKGTAKTLGDLAVARVERDAKIVRAEGDAEGQKLRIEAIKNAGDTGHLIATQEANIRMAEAAGKNGGIVILPGTSQPIDPIQVAILDTLRGKSANANGGHKQ